MKYRENREIILLVAISLILGFALIGIGVASIPKNCELIGEDTAGLDSFCFDCPGQPQICSDELGTLSARMSVGAGFFSILFPLTYGFMKALKRRSAEEARELKINL